MSSSSTPSAAPATTKYRLETGPSKRAPVSLRSGIKRFVPLVAEEKRHIIIAVAAITISSTDSSEMVPCSQSINTQSNPAWPSISTSCGDGIMTEAP